MTERGEEAGIRIRIAPEPTDEEAAAIAGVVAAIASAAPGEARGTEAPAADRWALAGRQEALRGPLWPVEWDGFGRAAGDGGTR